MDSKLITINCFDYSLQTILLNLAFKIYLWEEGYEISTMENGFEVNFNIMEKTVKIIVSSYELLDDELDYEKDYDIYIVGDLVNFW